MPQALCPQRRNKSSLGAWSGWKGKMKTGDKWMWGTTNIQWEEKEQKVNIEMISLCLKEIFNSFKGTFFTSYSSRSCHNRKLHSLHDLNGPTPSRSANWHKWKSAEWIPGLEGENSIMSPSVQHVRRLFPFSLGEDIKLLLMLHLSMLGHKTFVCFRHHGSWEIFLQGMILSL